MQQDARHSRRYIATAEVNSALAGNAHFRHDRLAYSVRNIRVPPYAVNEILRIDHARYQGAA